MPTFLSINIYLLLDETYFKRAPRYQWFWPRGLLINAGMEPFRSMERAVRALSRAWRTQDEALSKRAK
jgi:hypothetical protein